MTTCEPSAWPTPNTMAGGGKTRSGERGQEMLLPGLVSAWPTPAHNEFVPVDIPRMLERREREKAKGRNGTGFGLTVGMLTAWNESGFSPLASPASLPPAPESSEEAQMTAGSGQRLCACFDCSTPLGRFSKILLESATWASPEFSLKWKLRVTKCGSTVFQLARSVRRTGGSGTGSWPTTRAADTKSECWAPGRLEEKMLETRGQPLPRVLMAWATPMREDKELAGSPGTGYLTPQLRSGPVSSGCLAQTENFAVRLMILSAWLMGYPWSYLKAWERKGAKKWDWIFHGEKRASRVLRNPLLTGRSSARLATASCRKSRKS